MNLSEVISVVSLVGGVFFAVIFFTVKSLTSKVSLDLSEFKKGITTKIDSIAKTVTAIDKNLAIKSTILDATINDINEVKEYCNVRRCIEQKH